MAPLALPPAVEHYSSRDDWGGGSVRSGHAVDPAQFVGFVEHHTVFAMRDYDRDGFLLGDIDDVRRYMQVLQVARPDLGGEVPYSWVIFPGSRDDTCIIAEGRGRGRTGAHTAGLNSTRYAWAIAGNTDADRPVTPGMVSGMRWLAAVMLVDPEHAVPAIGHRQAPPYIDSKGQNLNSTGCPGNQGLSVLPQLQPPYRLDQPTSAPVPTPEEPPLMYVHQIANANGALWKVWGFAGQMPVDLGYLRGPDDVATSITFYGAGTIPGDQSALVDFLLNQTQKDRPGAGQAITLADLAAHRDQILAGVRYIHEMDGQDATNAVSVAATVLDAMSARLAA